MNSTENADEGEGGVSKIPKILHTSYVHRPLLPRFTQPLDIALFDVVMASSGARMGRNLATNPQCLCDKGVPLSSCSLTPSSLSRESDLAGNTNRRLPMRQPARSSSPVISPLRHDDVKELYSLLPPLSTGE